MKYVNIENAREPIWYKKKQNFQTFGRRYRKHFCDPGAGKDFLNKTRGISHKDW